METVIQYTTMQYSKLSERAPGNSSYERITSYPNGTWVTTTGRQGQEG